MSEIETDEVARRLLHSAKAVREWMAHDCPPEDTPKLQIALLAEFSRSVADDHLKRHNVGAKRDTTARGQTMTEDTITDTSQRPAVVAPLERQVRPAAWIQHHKAGDNLEWEDPGGKRTALYDEQTLWNACARVAELERAKLKAELKIAMEHSAWDGVLQLDDALRNISDLRA